MGGERKRCWVFLNPALCSPNTLYHFLQQFACYDTQHQVRVASQFLYSIPAANILQKPFLIAGIIGIQGYPLSHLTTNPMLGAVRGDAIVTDRADLNHQRVRLDKVSSPLAISDMFKATVDGWTGI